jgi:[ribosomal protein S5]-alanine N-acetyltransferase
VQKLTTNRLHLREITIDDAPAIYSYFSNEEVTKLYGMEPFTTIEQAEQLVRHFATSLEQNRGMRWAIELKEQPGLIGTIGFNLLSTPNKRAEVGYELHPDFWGKGLVGEALEAVVKFGFEELQLNRIGATVFIENKASQQVLIKQGFEREGLLRQYIVQSGNAHDVYIYAKING